MSTLIIIAVTLSTLVLAVTVSGIAILSIKDLVHAFSNNQALPANSASKAKLGRIQVMPSVA